MDGNRFDAITRAMSGDASRRQMFGGVLGGLAALLTGTTVLEAKKNGKGRGKGRGKGGGKKKGKGKGRGRPKVQFCHRTESEDFVLISVGAPAAKAHRRHGDERCEPGVCEVATGCDADGSCIFEPAEEGTACELEGDTGECNAVGECVTEML